ncbi:hypothetical protein AQJ23_01040 [Streptomyces antibioticus]|nr:hypothetical protein AQJ23_01040 [Streptomyces antibioticus]
MLRGPGVGDGLDLRGVLDVVMPLKDMAWMRARSSASNADSRLSRLRSRSARWGGSAHAFGDARFPRPYAVAAMNHR